jgi:hypothetical protein
MRGSDRGEVLLEAILFTPLLLAIGAFGATIGFRAFQRAELSQLLHAQIESESVRLSTLLTRSEATELKLKQTADGIFSTIISSLPKGTPLDVSLFLLDESGEIIDSAQSSNLMNRDVRTAAIIRFASERSNMQGNERLLPYSLSPQRIERNLIGLYISVEAQLSDFFNDGTSPLAEAQLRLLRREGS